MRAAVRLLKEAGAHAVKLEGGRKREAHLRALLDAEIPVMGHLGLTPQSVLRLGGFRVQGRGEAAAAAILDDARFLADAGCFALVLECVPAALAARITAGVADRHHRHRRRRRLRRPGAGLPRPAGHVPRVAAEVRAALRRAWPAWPPRRSRAYAADVRAGDFPGPEHAFGDENGQA